MKKLTIALFCCFLPAWFSTYSISPASTLNSVVTKPEAALNAVIDSVYSQIGLERYGLDRQVFHYAMIGFYKLAQEGKLSTKKIITIIDYSKPSTEKRFYTIDLDTKTVLFNSLVSHGKNTGENLAAHFSNKMHSNQSSLGFYITGETYVGSKGYSLRLDGLEQEYNTNMRARAVVVHAADYVSESWIKKYGRLGRSQGCPALPREITKSVIDTIKDRTLIFGYFNDSNYLSTSALLDEKSILSDDYDYSLLANLR